MRRLDIIAQRLDFSVQHLAAQANGLAPQLTRQLARLQARRELLAALDQGALDQTGLADKLEQIIERSRARARQQPSGNSGSDPRAGPLQLGTARQPSENWARMLLGTWLTCRAISENTPTHCEQIPPGGGSEATSCLWLSARVRTLYAGRCDDGQGLQLAARLTGLPVSTMRALCLAIAGGKPQDCARHLDDTFGRAVCQAMASRSPGACVTTSLSAKQKTDCRREYEVFGAVHKAQGKDVLRLRRRGDSQACSGMAALSGNADCARVALQCLEENMPLWLEIVGIE